MKKRLFGDQLFEYRVKEGKGTKPGVLMTVEGVFQRGGVKNANDRVYPTDLWHKVLSQEDVKSRLENKQMYGQFGHPGDGTTDPMKISHVVTRQELRSDGVVWGEADVLDTPAGQVVATLFEAGSKLGISSRGDGSIESKGGTDEVQDDYRLETYDFVLRPSTPGAFPGLAESVEENEKLVAEAIEGLVKRTDIPDRVPVLAQCLDILSVLESRNSGDKVKMVVESIQEELGKKTLLEVSANPSINPLELLQQQESIMPYAGMTPVPAMPAGTPPVQDPNLLQWHQNQVNQAVHQVATQKENEVRGLKDTLIKAQREHQETKRKL
ncbi:MAG: hypothetical protein MJA83_16560, partial [Gammaproteobacteria bacterium]|nr:hypothetical protein [Gammaproteobacteria bacterium]